MKTVYFIFIDGLGIGTTDPAVNPLALLDLLAFEKLAGNQPMTDAATPVVSNSLIYHGIDANLDVDGLPQSGTGQATLFTGVNCSKLAAKHFGPYPHSTSHETIEQLNIFSRLLEAGTPLKHLAFANCYPSRFFEFANKTSRWTVTTKCTVSAGVRIRVIEDLKRGAGLAADITGEGLSRIEPEVQVVDEQTAAQNLLALGERNTFVLFEYFHTDKAGHSQSFDRAEKRLRSLDRFFTTILDRFDADNDVLVMTSDHGNIEDLSTKSHTRNPVPFVAYGKNASHFKDVQSLIDVTPAVVGW